MKKIILSIILGVAAAAMCVICPVQAEEEPAPAQTYNEILSRKPIYDEKDLRLLSAIIFEEAGNQCLAGQQAVGIVVLNRVKSTRFPNTVEEVLYQYGQFFNPSCLSFYNDCLAKYDNGTIPLSCIEAAIYALEGNVTVNYNNYFIDLSTILFFSRYRKDCRVQIQDHQFS